jgi:predicted permease
MNGMILRDVPGVTKPDQLVTLRGPSSFPAYKRYRERSDLFSSTLAYAAPVPLGVSLGGYTERTWGHLVTASYFPTLGVRPYLGQVFGSEHEQPGRAPTVVVSYRFWQEHLGSDPLVTGKVLRINGQPCTVIGIGPKDFFGASPTVYGADLWLPVAVDARVAPELAGNALEQHDKAIFHFIARLQPGVSAASAEAALDTVARQLEQEYGEPDKNQKGRRVTLLPGGKLIPVRKQDLPFLTGYFTLLGGMILLIASSNVANMMLARAADRRREIAVRLALGAGRGRLIRQLLTESLLLAGGAGVLGFLLSVWVMRGASQIKMPYPMPLSLRLEPDGRVLLFTLALTLFTGLAFGLAPALQAARTDLTPALKEGGNVRLRRYRRLSLRNLLVLSQVAGSLALLLITGFLVLGHRTMAGVEVGFDARNLHLISLDPVRDGYSVAQATNFFPKLLDRVKGLPSVTAASLSDSVPMEMIGRPFVPFSVSGAGQEKVIYSGRKYVVGRDFFDTIGIPIVHGRGFRMQDEANDASAAIVSEKLVRRCWPGQDPLGRQIELGNETVPQFGFAGGSSGPRISAKTRKFEVVGVAKDVRDGLVMVAADSPPVIYLPLRPADYARPLLQGVTLAVRAAQGVDVIAAVRREISAVDDKLTPFHARSMPQQIEQMMFPVRMALWTYGCIGVFGLILASVGLAGVTAYSVTQRRREIGIRIALGARGADVLGLVMKEGAVLVAVGTTIGLAVAWAGMRVLSSFMSQVARTAGTSASDPALLLGAPLLLASLALAACYVPARKSMRVDPVVTLRQE